VRCAILNTFNRLGMPVTAPHAWNPPRGGEASPCHQVCNNATRQWNLWVI